MWIWITHILIGFLQIVKLLISINIIDQRDLLFTLFFGHPGSISWKLCSTSLTDTPYKSWVPGTKIERNFQEIDPGVSKALQNTIVKLLLWHSLVWILLCVILTILASIFSNFFFIFAFWYWQTRYCRGWDLQRDWLISFFFHFTFDQHQFLKFLYLIMQQFFIHLLCSWIIFSSFWILYIENFGRENLDSILKKYFDLNDSKIKSFYIKIDGINLIQ